MKPDRSGLNVVSRARGNARSRVSRRTAMLVLLTVGILAAGVAALAPTRFIRGVSLTALIFVAIGAVIAWLSGAGTQLSKSGRDMGDDWQTQWNAPPTSGGDSPGL